MKIIAKDAKATAALARTFARRLKGGEVIGLIGNLGSGKTTFIQALAKALGVKERVTSPTFVYFHVHRLDGSKVKGQRSKVRLLVHADAYRADARTLRGLGLEEYFGQPGTVVLVEWADRVKALMPKGSVSIRFVHLGKDRRSVGLPKI